MILFDGVHPLEGGAFRLKSRRDRRQGMKIESPLVFYPRYWLESLRKMGQYLSIYLPFRTILKETLAAPDRWTYSDLSIAKPKDDEFEALELYHATTGGEAALARKRREDAIREKVTHAAE